MFTYTLRSWLLANLIHPLVTWLFFLIVRGAPAGLTNESGFAFDGMIWFLAYSLIFSLPVLLISWFILGVVAELDHPITTKFYILLAYAAALLFIVALVIAIFFIPQQPTILLGFIPAILSATIALIIRYQQFKSLFTVEIS